MKKRIRFIILIMTISIIGIISLQVLWVANSYKVKEVQLLKDINQSLENAVQEEYNIRFSSFAEFDFNDSSTMVISGTDTPDNANLDSILNNLLMDGNDFADGDYTIKIDATDLEKENKINQLPENLDFKLKNVLKSILTAELDQESLIKEESLDSLFRLQLATRGVHGTYELEITKDTADYQELNSCIVSDIIPISLLKKKFVRAVFHSKYQLVLNKMINILIATFLLIIIAILSFIYMLRTILRQKKLSEIKNDFINNMTHELKTPIATVSTAIEAMLNFGAMQDKEKSENYLNISYKELQRLSGLIEKVLNVSRLERKNVELYIEELNAIEIFNDITEKYYTGTTKDVKFNIENQVSIFKVNADRTHFTNVINNLIDNAIKYSDEYVEVDLNCDKRNGFNIITVKDNGWGISKENQKKIFDKFYRVPKGDLHNVKGFGLGLHYAYNIINQHGGTLEVKSALGKGCEFIIKLPTNE